MQKRLISLPQGGELEVDLTPEFLGYVRRQLDIAEGEKVTDDDIRMFIYGSVKSALDSVESDPEWIIKNDLE